jgi:protein SCO1/2
MTAGASAAAALAAGLLLVPASRVRAALPAAELVKKAGFEQRLGAPLPPDAPFRDAAGRRVTLGSLLGKRPLMLVPVYLSCPMLCPLALDGLVKSLRLLPQSVGRDYDVVVYSFDPRDTPAKAAERRRALVAQYRRAGSDGGFHVLTGDAAAIARLDRAVGLTPVSDTGQFAHAPGVVVVTPEGRASRYLYGIEYSARDLRFALLEASAGRLGSLTDQALLLCFHYDETSGRYTLSVLRALRVLGAVTLAAVAVSLAALSRGRRA